MIAMWFFVCLRVITPPALVKQEKKKFEIGWFKFIQFAGNFFFPYS